MNVDYKVLGHRVQKLRKKCNLTQEQLAELTELSVVYISSIERAKRTPTLDTIVGIVNALGCTVDDLLDGYLKHQRIVKQDHFEQIFADCTSQERRFLMRCLKEVLLYLDGSGL